MHERDDHLEAVQQGRVQDIWPVGCRAPEHPAAMLHRAEELEDAAEDSLARPGVSRPARAALSDCLVYLVGPQDAWAQVLRNPQNRLKIALARTDPGFPNVAHDEERHLELPGQGLDEVRFPAAGHAGQ